MVQLTYLGEMAELFSPDETQTSNLYTERTRMPALFTTALLWTQ